MSGDTRMSCGAAQAANNGTEGMVFIPGGSFLMGSERFYLEERPVRQVTVDGFWIDEHPVTNAEFASYVDTTGYLTVAERPVHPADYPFADPNLMVPGSAVFQQPAGPVDLRDIRNWWAYVPGASWRYPEGPGSTILGREDHPVVHVAYEDAQTYARWLGKSLPTEAEWEYAARGGLEGATYPWGEDLKPHGKTMANTWEGAFPWENIRDGGHYGTSPVKSFSPNGYGLYDCVGNVWEWTTDEFSRGPSLAAGKACCTPSEASVNCDRGRGSEVLPPRVVKGGSFLCASNYCLRYRPAARQPEPCDTSTCHLGFRCVIRGSRMVATPASRARPLRRQSDADHRGTVKVHR